MKKKILIGIATVALAAVPVGAFASVSVTDTASVTVSESESLTASHTAGSGTGAGSWSSNTLSSTMSGGTVGYNLGSTTLTYTANYLAGYKVTVDTEDLSCTTSGYTSLTIPYNTSYSASSSGWAVANGSESSSTRYADGETIVSGSQVSGGTTTVYYGAGVSSTQAACTYQGTAVYTLQAAS